MMKILIPFVTFYLLLTSCSKEVHVDIDLKDKHLEELPAGNWLKIFDIDYSSNKESKIQITEKLKNEGKLLDEYVHQENSNNVKTYLWNFKNLIIKEEYFKGGVWEGSEIVPYKEYYNAGTNIWITIIFKEPKPYSDLLPEDFKKINPNRKYEHTATIESEKDGGRRLFLFGRGNYCERISLF